MRPEFRYEVRYEDGRPIGNAAKVYNRYTGEERSIDYDRSPGAFVLLEPDEVLWLDGEPKRIDKMPLFRRLQKWLMGG
jgi:hypothetical protein